MSAQVALLETRTEHRTLQDNVDMSMGRARGWRCSIRRGLAGDLAGDLADDLAESTI